MVTCVVTRIASHEPTGDGADQGRFARAAGNSRVRGAPIIWRSAMRLSLACLVAFLSASGFLALRLARVATGSLFLPLEAAVEAGARRFFDDRR